MTTANGSTTDAPIRGATELVRFLESAGQRHVFGLPGSSMVAVLDALENSSVEFVPGVHEASVVAMADGYARVTGSGYALLYMMPGTANALANLYNAWRDESPIVVLATQQATDFRTGTATIGEADLAQLVAPYTRLAREVQPGMLRFGLEKAARAAAGPPSGPAFLSLPEDVLVDEHVEHRAPRTPERAPSTPADVTRVAEALVGAERPLIMVGGQVRRHGGVDVLERLAERLDIPVVPEPAWNERLPINPGHSHAFTSIVRPDGLRLEREADVVVAVGCRFVCEAHPRSGPWFPAARFVAHVNADAAKLDELRSGDWSCACDPAEFLGLLDEETASPSATVRAARRSWIDTVRATDVTKASGPYGAPAAALHDVLEHGWLIDESVTGTPAVVAALRSGDGARFAGNTGYSLGWGASAACGVAIGSGEHVTCTIGDGALLFGVQGLWTASELGLPIKFVVWDNRGYGSTRKYSRAYRRTLGGDATAPEYLGSVFRGAPRPADVLSGFGIPTRTVMPGDDLATMLADARGKDDGPQAVVVELGLEP